MKCFGAVGPVVGESKYMNALLQNETQELDLFTGKIQVRFQNSSFLFQPASSLSTSVFTKTNASCQQYPFLKKQISTFLTWPEVWRLFPAVQLPDAGGPHSRQRKHGCIGKWKEIINDQQQLPSFFFIWGSNSPQTHQLPSDKGRQLSPGL